MSKHPFVTRQLVPSALAGALLLSGALHTAQAATRSKASVAQISGAGSTFDAPFFTAGFAAYAKSSGVTVTYTANGSAVGVTQFISNKVDFGATDVPMTPIEAYVATQTGGPFVEIPVILGAVAVVFNPPEVGSHTLQLDGPTLARILLGQISTWNDPAIVNLNPSISLPATRIVPLHRLDRSGTTNIFTAYLSSISPQWANAVGSGKSVGWPVGTAVTGGKGMVSAVANTTGSIGYVDLSAAISNKLSYAAIKNQANTYQLPTQASVAQAAAVFPAVTSTNYAITNASGHDSYPIATYSWVLLRQHHANSARGATLASLFRWMTGTGQNLAGPLNYVPLPATVQALDAKALSNLQ